jgi:hypothetical protein
MTARRPARRASAALGAALGALVALGPVAACSGGGGGSAGPATSDTSIPELDVPSYSDPSVPIQVPVGRRFAIVLPVDPSQGWHWVVEPVDIFLLTPLGSEFREDPELLAAATTTTTAPPPPEESTTLPAVGGAEAATTTTSSTEPPSTTTTVPGPYVQVLSYVGRTDGRLDVTVRRERIGASEEELARAETLVFHVVIGTPPPDPAASVPPTSVAGGT